MKQPQSVALHDLLLKTNPELAQEHAASGECPFCAEDDNPEGGVSDKTYTEEQVKAAVDEAVAAARTELEARIEELEAVKEKSEIDVAVAAATEELTTKVADLESKLDEKTIEANTAAERVEAIETYLTEVAEAAEKAAEVAARKEERVTAVRDVANFSDEEIADRADRWAEMAAEDFERQLEDYKAIASKIPNSGREPKRSPLSAAADDTKPDPKVSRSGLREALALSNHDWAAVRSDA